MPTLESEVRVLRSILRYRVLNKPTPTLQRARRSAPVERRAHWTLDDLPSSATLTRAKRIAYDSWRASLRSVELAPRARAARAALFAEVHAYERECAAERDRVISRLLRELDA
ncbi:hypothetical protein EPN42_10965 [bacterium]|nr:MAG: hypothetical protein EPN42_10965 [bacterium]